MRHREEIIEILPGHLQRIIESLDILNPEERIEIFHCYCPYCGDKNQNCQCWNDE